MNVYYLKDKQCKLIDRSDPANPVDFVIKAPNGRGIHDIDFEEIDETMFTDAEGILRKAFTDYRISLRFVYSSHMMDLLKLLDADEVQIPIAPFYEDEDTKQKLVNFVLMNDGVVGEYFSGLYQLSGSQYEEIFKGETLEFKSVDTYSRYELREMFRLIELSPQDYLISNSIDFISSQQETIDKSKEGYSITLNENQ